MFRKFFRDVGPNGPIAFVARCRALVQVFRSVRLSETEMTTVELTQNPKTAECFGGRTSVSAAELKKAWRVSTACCFEPTRLLQLHPLAHDIQQLLHEAGAGVDNHCLLGLTPSIAAFGAAL
jgi:hypothetical protein